MALFYSGQFFRDILSQLEDDFMKSLEAEVCIWIMLLIGLEYISDDSGKYCYQIDHSE